MRQWILSLAVLALVAAPAFAGAGKYNTKVAVGDKAPSFEGLPAVAGDKEVSLALADVKEEVVVVAFLANHCPAVQSSEDRLVEVVNSYKGKSVKFIGICCSGPQMSEEDGIPGIKKAFGRGKYNLGAYAYDPNGAIGKAYGATRTPQFFVLDKSRTIKYMGAMDDSPNNEAKVTKNYLKPAIDAVLANETIEITETRAVGCGIMYKN